MDKRITGLDLKSSLSILADFLMPRVCVVCGRKLLPVEKHICTCCLADMPLTHFEEQTHNPMADKLNALVECDRYAFASALFFYNPESAYSRITRALKYRRDISAGKHFASILGELLAGSGHFRDVDLVIPVPLHPFRSWKRGYNQAGIIAREVAGALGAPMETGLLKRVRNTTTQTRMSGAAKARNVLGAFAVKDISKASGIRLDSADGCRKGGRAGHILIIDDVFTSGSTLAACHKALHDTLGDEVRISVATLGYVGE